MRTASAIRSGGSPAKVRRRYGRRRLGGEPRAAGEDLDAGAVGALGEHDVVLARVEPGPDVEAARRRADAAGAELAVDGGDERVARARAGPRGRA